MVVKKCVVCGKAYDNMAANPDHPDKQICLGCLNGFILNLKTLEEEIEPLFKALETALEDLDKKL